MRYFKSSSRDYKDHKNLTIFTSIHQRYRGRRSTIITNVFPQHSAQRHSDLDVLPSPARPSLAPAVTPVPGVEVEGLEGKVGQRLVGNDVDVASLAATSSRGTLLGGRQPQEGDAAIAALPSPALDLNLVYELSKHL